MNGCNTNLLQKSLVVNGLRMYNNLSFFVFKTSGNVKTLKNRLRKIFFYALLCRFYDIAVNIFIYLSIL